ncbi:MAG TPA: zinc ribbon domain-containing protein [Gammaproteobacteria bacterium]|nr:zinc ribbon domain-containing protein [Gammaproteobacteria bacterium]
MPIYEYECQACGHEMEAWQKISDEPLRKCPECGKMKLQKLVSAAGFRLKGGGWYETDFKTSGKKNVAGQDTSSGTKTDKKSDKSAAKDAGAAA